MTPLAHRPGCSLFPAVVVRLHTAHARWQVLDFLVFRHVTLSNGLWQGSRSGSELSCAGRIWLADAMLTIWRSGSTRMQASAACLAQFRALLRLASSFLPPPLVTLVRSTGTPEHMPVAFPACTPTRALALLCCTPPISTQTSTARATRGFHPMTSLAQATCLVRMPPSLHT